MPLSADGERQRAMAVDVGAGRSSNEWPMEQLAVDWEGFRAANEDQVRKMTSGRPASTAEQARRRRKMAAAQSAMSEW